MMDSSSFNSQRTAFFDLETTGLDSSCEIIQLAAVSGGHTLSLFVVPGRQIDPGASRVTGFTVKDRRLFLHGRPVQTCSLKEALLSFISFLRMLDHPLLLGHNIRRFDCRVLTRALDKFGLRSELLKQVSGFVDTLPLARQLLKGKGIKSFKQENLVKSILGISYAAHNALEDVQALQKLYTSLNPSANQIQEHTFTLDLLTAETVNGAGVRHSAQSDLCEHFSQALDFSRDEKDLSRKN